MKERGIIMSGDSVRAILDGRKTQTRRVIRFGRHTMPRKYPLDVGSPELLHRRLSNPDVFEFGCDCADCRADNTHSFWLNSPYAVGDHLYVRETHYRFGQWVSNGTTKAGKPAWRFEPETDEVRFFNDAPRILGTRATRDMAWHRRPAIFLPKKLARIWREVTGVRGERVQEISEEDCIAEGIDPKRAGAQWRDMPLGVGRARERFHARWDKLNAKRGYGWDANPWNFVYDFKRIEK